MWRLSFKRSIGGRHDFGPTAMRARVVVRYSRDVKGRCRPESLAASSAIDRLSLTRQSLVRTPDNLLACVERLCRSQSRAHIVDQFDFASGQSFGRDPDRGKRLIACDAKTRK
jgi:hypothetical protein